MNIHFHFQARTALKNRQQLKKFLGSLSRKEGRRLQGLNIIFCSDGDLLSINRAYLQHDYYTDIITFDLSEHGSTGITGEIYISVDRVRDNAVNYGRTMTNELHRVIFHGLLHLCGYSDKTKKAQQLMRQKEDEYLEAYFR